MFNEKVPEIHLSPKFVKSVDDVPKQTLQNPFVHRLVLEGCANKLKAIVLSITLVPVRLVAILILLFWVWLFSFIVQFGGSFAEFNRSPLVNWRKFLQRLSSRMIRVMFMVISFNWIKVKGVKASVTEAPLVVVAPHSSFFDIVVAALIPPPITVAKAEASKYPVLGKIVNFTQPIYVRRHDPDSRKLAIKAINNIINSDEEWPQIFIFPEGQCTNRSSLITFKPGAFYPGVPVQPVLIRYPNKFDTITWTFEGPTMYRVLWLTMTQFHSNCEVEFLPVYVPNDEEKLNPKLYAFNVRNVMAKALGLPVSVYENNDCRLLLSARNKKEKYFKSMVEVERLREKIGMNQTNIEKLLTTSHLENDPSNSVSYSDFCLRLQIPCTDAYTSKLYSLFDPSCTGRVDLREYLHCANFIIDFRNSFK